MKILCDGKKDFFFFQVVWEVVAHVLSSVTGFLRPRFNFRNFINKYIHNPMDDVERNFSRIFRCIYTRHFAQYYMYVVKFESFFISRHK